MKKPYREGMWFDVPLGDGRRAPAQLLRDRHHVLDVAAYSPNGDPVWSGSVSDRGLLLARWRPIDAPAVRANGEHRVLPRFFRTAHAERTIARACGVAVPDEPAHRVYDLGRLRTLDAAALECASILQWRRRLRDDHVRVLDQWLAAGGDAVSLYGEAVCDLARIADRRIRDLALCDDPGEWPVMPFVESLTFEGVAPFADIARAFPNLRSLRIAARDRVVDLDALTSLAHLRALDLAHVRIDARDLARLQRLTALRLARVDGFDSVAPLSALGLDTLAIEEQPRLHDLTPLRSVRTLEQIELRGLWQFSMTEMEWLYELPLLRATIDIGGRRKNAELYRRASWACAWPFYCSTASATRTNR